MEWAYFSRCREGLRGHVGLARSGLSCYNPPCLKLALAGNGGVRRAGGRQAQVFNGPGSDNGAHMLAVARLGLGAIEKHTGDLGMMPEERRKVVRDERCVIDAGIQAALAAA